MAVGDVTSSARGSGARFNDGKVPLELLDLAVLTQSYARIASPPNEAQAQALSALLYIAEWQQTGKVSCLYEAIEAVGSPWHACARVFDYGRNKYSKRGACTCGISANKDGNANAALNRRLLAACASPVTTNSSRPSHPHTASGSDKIGETGIGPTSTESRLTSANGTPDVALTQNMLQPSAPQNSSENTALRRSGMPTLSPADAGFADPGIDCALTIVTPRDRSVDACATRATSDLASSSGQMVGLNEHLPTCGIHQISKGDWNWSKGMLWSVPLGCAVRHLEKIILQDESLDPESDLPHVGHFLCNLVMLITFHRTYPEGDDRPRTLIPTLSPPYQVGDAARSSP